MLNAETTLMEVCGTHTHAIATFGIRKLLPNNVRLLSGPGCPVCVTSNNSIDKMIALSRIPGVIITTFGDMMRVPGSTTSLIEQKAQGAHIEVVYSPLDALELASKTTDEVIFLGVGFETTAPTSAATIIRASEMGLNNFSIFSAHKNMPGALELIVNDPELKVDGLILPGHVSTITGLAPYRFLAKKYNIPGVVSGFEANDILLAINMLEKQIESGKAIIENGYPRGVKDEGNPTALKLISEVFDTCSATWRGLGEIEGSGYKIRRRYKAFDAEEKFTIKEEPTKENSACQCGNVLKGIITPSECPLFKKICTPQNPVGPCMVSSEGSCSAHFKYLN